MEIEAARARVAFASVKLDAALSAGYHAQAIAAASIEYERAANDLAALEALELARAA